MITTDKASAMLNRGLGCLIGHQLQDNPRTVDRIAVFSFIRKLKNYAIKYTINYVAISRNVVAITVGTRLRPWSIRAVTSITNDTTGPHPTMVTTLTAVTATRIVIQLTLCKIQTIDTILCLHHIVLVVVVLHIIVNLVNNNNNSKVMLHLRWTRVRSIHGWRKTNDIITKNPPPLQLMLILAHRHRYVVRRIPYNIIRPDKLFNRSLRTRACRYSHNPIPITFCKK